MYIGAFTKLFCILKSTRVVGQKEEELIRKNW